MTLYSYCGLSIASNIPLLELPLSDRKWGRFLFTVESGGLETREFIQAGYRDHPGRRFIPSYGFYDSKHWLRFPDLADFQISAGARQISCFPVQYLPADTIRHLLLDQVMPRCLAHQGKIMLHASAVQLNNGVILFIGDSGSGKSTLAANFEQAGSLVLSDDCVWVKESRKQTIAVPSYGGVRLWNDSLEFLFGPLPDADSMAHYSSKKRVRLNKNNIPEHSNHLPVLAAIVLSPLEQGITSEISLVRISKSETFIAMLSQTFQLNLWDQERVKRHMQKLGHLVPMLNAYRLTMPHEYTLLPRVRQMIMEILP